MGSVVDFLQTFGELLKVKHICAVIIKIMKVKVNSINYYFLFFIFQVTFTNVFIEIEQAPCNKNVFHIAREFEHSFVFFLWNIFIDWMQHFIQFMKLKKKTEKFYFWTIKLNFFFKNLIFPFFLASHSSILFFSQEVEEPPSWNLLRLSMTILSTMRRICLENFIKIGHKSHNFIDRNW